MERLRKTLRRRVGFALLDLIAGAAVALVVGLASQQLLARASALAMTLPQGIHLYAAWGSAAVCLLFGAWVGLTGRMRPLAFWR